MQVVPSTQMQTVDGRLWNDYLIYSFNIHTRHTSAAVSPQTDLEGWAIELPGGLDDDAKQTIKEVTEMMANTSPFKDNFLVSQLRDGEEDGVVERGND